MKNNAKMEDFVVGVDIGGSHITAGLISITGKAVVNDRIVRCPVDPHAEAEEILRTWCKTIRQLWNEFGIEKCKLGFAMPGPFDYANGLCLIKGFDKYESLYNVNVRDALAEKLNIGGSEIAFRNDAEAFLEGELFCGAAAGYKHAIGITLGTGLGSAASHDGITKDAALSVLEYKGEKIEEFVSTRGIVRIYREITGNTLKDVLAIAELYDTEPDAVKTFKIFAEGLSWFLGHFIKKEKPEILVIGGNIANSRDLFMNDVIQHLSLSVTGLPKIVKATLGENAALIGGACCWGKQVQNIRAPAKDFETY